MEFCFHQTLLDKECCKHAALLWQRNQLCSCQNSAWYFHTASGRHCKMGQVGFFIHYLTSRNKLIWHQTSEVKENNEHDLHIWCTLSYYFQSCRWFYHCGESCFISSYPQTHVPSPITISFIKSSSTSACCKRSAQKFSQDWTKKQQQDPDSILNHAQTSHGCHMIFRTRLHVHSKNDLNCLCI
jgi:hypothetical protein